MIEILPALLKVQQHHLMSEGEKYREEILSLERLSTDEPSGDDILS
jgi:hypothetical protein